MTVLVTGASGFLCSYFLETVAVFNETASPGCRVLALDNFTSGLPERLHWVAGRPDIELRQCDVSKGVDPGEPVQMSTSEVAIPKCSSVPRPVAPRIPRECASSIIR